MKFSCYFSEINRGDIKDTEIEATMDSIVDSLFSVFVTLGGFAFCLKKTTTTKNVWNGRFLCTPFFRVSDFVANCIAGTVPIIRCPRGNAAEMIAEKLDKKLRDNIRDTRNSLFTLDSVQAGQFSFQRPLLVILDRNVDLATPFHHTWTYQALAHDVLVSEILVHRTKSSS